MFKYNAAGGGGSGTVQQLDGDLCRLTFDASTLAIPDLNYKTASVLGLPIPPPLNIAIVPSKLEVRRSAAQRSAVLAGAGRTAGCWWRC
jgi:hypothetical protein